MLELRRRFAGEVTALSEYLDRDLVTLWGYDKLRLKTLANAMEGVCHDCAHVAPGIRSLTSSSEVVPIATVPGAPSAPTCTSRPSPDRIL